MTSSDIILDSMVDKQLLNTSWAFVNSRRLKDSELLVRVNTSDLELKKILIAELNKHALIKIDSDIYDLSIDQDEDSFVVHVDDLPIFSAFVGDIEEKRFELIESVTSYARVRMLRTLENHDKNLETELQIIPVETQGVGRKISITKKLSIESKRNEAGTIVFEEGESFVFGVKNQGRKEVYVSLIEIQPDNEVNILLPRPFESSSDYLIQPGEYLSLDRIIWEITPPYGINAFKLIATESKLNLHSMIISRGDNEKESNSPIEQLFNYAIGEESGIRGAKPPKIMPSNAHIYNSIINIVSRK